MADLVAAEPAAHATPSRAYRPPQPGAARAAGQASTAPTGLLPAGLPTQPGIAVTASPAQNGNFSHAVAPTR